MINITSWTELNNIRNQLSEDYQLMNDLLSSDLDYSGIGDDWTPIYDFSGSFNGNNFKIYNLISTGNTNHMGFFGSTENESVISNVVLIDVDITANKQSGALCGHNLGSIINSSATGSVNSSGFENESIGGLVGINEGSIDKSYFIGKVKGEYSMGGLVGLNNGDITNSYVIGSVTGIQINGGLTAVNSGTIQNSYSIMEVSGGSYLSGGLVGNNTGIINNSYATGIVTCTGGDMGGLVGGDSGTINNCGWFRNSSGATKAIGIGAEYITYNIRVDGEGNYIDDTVDWFYDKTREIYTIDEIGSEVWDFITIWHEQLHDYPKFVSELNPQIPEKDNKQYKYKYNPFSGQLQLVNKNVTILGTSAPIIIPANKGDIYIDINNKKIYFATGTTNSIDWTIVN